jgi:hypothetical protein
MTTVVFHNALLGQERREARGELHRMGDHRRVVAGELDQRGAERGGERLRAAVGVELAAVLAGGDDDPVGERGDAVEVEVVVGDRGDVTADEQLDIAAADLGPVT